MVDETRAFNRDGEPAYVGEIPADLYASVGNCTDGIQTTVVLMCRATPGLMFFRLRIQHYTCMLCSYTSQFACSLACVVACTTYL